LNGRIFYCHNDIHHKTISNYSLDYKAENNRQDDCTVRVDKDCKEKTDKDCKGKAGKAGKVAGKNPDGEDNKKEKESSCYENMANCMDYGN
jgi:lipocalin